MTPREARLYCILDLGYTPESRAEQVTASLLAGGADFLQLRAKNHDLVTIERVARRLLPLCRAAGIPFILNDFPELAAAIGADGVHIGQDGGTLAEAREKGNKHLACNIHSSTPPQPPSSNLQLPTSNFQAPTSNLQAPSSNLPAPSSHLQAPTSSLQAPTSSLQPPTSHLQPPSSPPRPFLIGRSTHSLAQARAALAEGFDYIGFGPLFPTPTKPGRPAIGLQDLAAMQREVGSQIPAFCIGGITPATLPQVLAVGAHRVVVVSALLLAPDVQAATHHLRDQLLRS